MTTTHVIKSASYYDYDDYGGDDRGRVAEDNGKWSHDTPTGVLSPDGRMICRSARSIGYLADN